uniref:Receptor expression-enhancing protein n=1 Tax=Globodera rostochiensis TaxID=31243 RepID=A0A914I0Z8_GLORO
MPTLPPQVGKFLDDFDKKLQEPSAFTNALGKVEAKTGLKRLHIAGALVVIYVLYLLFGQSAQLACNLTGFLYPAYISIKAIESHSKEDDTQWLTYWVVFALLNVVEFFSNTILYYFPFYWLLKCALLLWLYMPNTLGAQLLYVRIIRPFHHKNIDGMLNKAAGDVRKAYEERVKET